MTSEPFPAHLERNDLDTIIEQFLPSTLDYFLELALPAIAAGHSTNPWSFVRHWTGSDWIDRPDDGTADLNEQLLEAFTRAGWFQTNQRTGQPAEIHKYWLTDLGVRIAQRLQQRRGSALEQTEDDILKLVNSAAFAARHPKAAGHLQLAFTHLASESSDRTTVGRIGEELRNALSEVTAGLAPGTAEKPKDALERWRDGLESEGLHEREAKVLAALIEYVGAAVSLVQRATHVRDETDNKGEPEVSSSEIRRACFLTSVACYEIDQALLAVSVGAS